MKKVIVLGSNGMAGHIVTMGLRKEKMKYEVTAVARSTSSILPDILMDISQFDKLGDLINSSKPDVIINCVGLLNEVAEENIDQAILMNAYLPHFLEAHTKSSETKIVHISTDCVFDGTKGNYTETDTKDGIGYYAQSKALGEIINEKDLTLRTSIIGIELKDNGIGLFNWFSKQNDEIIGYSKAYWNGVTTIQLMNSIKIAIDEDITGLYHLASKHKISKHDLIDIFIKTFKRDIDLKMSSHYKIDKSLINTRKDYELSVPSYKVMLVEMKNWLKSNKDLYPHYTHLLEK